MVQCLNTGSKSIAMLEAHRPQDPKRDKHGIRTVQSILSACAGLCRLSERSNVFGVVHGRASHIGQGGKE